jgi:hypothetical protein
LIFFGAAAAAAAVIMRILPMRLDVLLIVKLNIGQISFLFALRVN